MKTELTTSDLQALIHILKDSTLRNLQIGTPYSLGICSDASALCIKLLQMGSELEAANASQETTSTETNSETAAAEPDPQ